MFLEVKSSVNLRPKDFNGLKAFGEDYEISKRIILYRGKDKLFKNGIMIIPVEEFLKKPEKFI